MTTPILREHLPELRRRNELEHGRGLSLVRAGQWAP